MKALKYLIASLVLFLAVWSCTDEEFGSTDFVETATAPANLTALFDITTDNTGLVTITPNGEGANFFDVEFGDNSAESASLKLGESVEHIYAEGSYEMTLTGYGITGLETEQKIPLTVSFKAPENLEVIITNDEAVSKKVNVIATADHALVYDVYFGEEGNDVPVTANIGEIASYVYQEAGTYTIRVVAKSAAIETTELSQEFEAKAILQPIKSAPVPPARGENDVISIFSGAYADVPGSDYFPDWGQAGQGSGWAMFELDGDQMLNYTTLSYQGIQIGEAQDLTTMEYLHMDIWTADLAQIRTFLINVGVDPAENVLSDLTVDEWTSIEIPMSAFTDQGVAIDNVHQFKFVSEPYLGGSVFIDNIYFYKAASEPVQLPIRFDSAAETFGTFNGATFEIVDDPEDMNNRVGKITNSGSEWEGSSLNLDVPVDFSVNKQIKLKFNSVTTGNTVLLKLENGTDDAVEVSQSVSQTGWSELTFDFSAANYSFPNSGSVDAFGAYSTMVIFVDGGQFTPGTYYIDDIEQVTGTDPTSEIMDFEPGSAVYEWEGFGDANFGPIPADVIANPDPSGINTSVNVVAIEKLAGAQTWAGASANLYGKADFSSGTTIKVKVWSPRVGTPIMFKMEDSNSAPDANGNPSVFLEVIVNSAVASAWEELEFDLTTDGSFDPSISYDRVILFPDFNNAGNGELFYFDDITVVDNGGGTTPPSATPYSPIDFEDGGYGADWTWTVFENDTNPEVEIIPNPDASGINSSATVAKITALQAGQPWVGCESLHGADIGSFSFDATNSTVKIMVWKSVISDVGIKFAEADGDAQVEIKVANTKINEWEELTFDLSGSIGAGATGVVDQIIIFPDFNLDGRDSDNVVYFDNITFGSN